MFELGALVACDRCPVHKFVKAGIPSPATEGGWSVKDDKNLCPTCTELYNKMMNNFFAPEVKRPINLED